MKFAKFIFPALLIAVSCEFTEFRHETLDDEGNYEVYWAIDYNTKKVQFNVTVKTRGFVGFGISNAGGMKDADIVVGGLFENGTAYFTVTNCSYKKSGKWQREFLIHRTGMQQ